MPTEELKWCWINIVRRNEKRKRDQDEDEEEIEGEKRIADDI